MRIIYDQALCFVRFDLLHTKTHSSAALQSSIKVNNERHI